MRSHVARSTFVVSASRVAVHFFAVQVVADAAFWCRVLLQEPHVQKLPVSEGSRFQCLRSGKDVLGFLCVPSFSAPVLLLALGPNLLQGYFSRV